MRSLLIVAPELVLSAASVAVLLTGLWASQKRWLVGIASAGLAVAAGFAFAMVRKPAQAAFNGMIVFDPFGLFFVIFAVAVTALGVALGADSQEIKTERRAEFFCLLLALSTGLIFMAIANHFLMVYLALETVSIVGYTLVGFGREKRVAVEAAMKYVVYGSLASAVFIYGLSLVFGVSGQIDLIGLRHYIFAQAPGQIPSLLWLGVFFVLVGLGFKISAAPMHMWTPDVYEGAPTPVAAFLSVGVKAAGFALLLRFLITAFTAPIEAASSSAVMTGEASQIAFRTIGPYAWPKLLMLSSIATMFVGNLAALGQVSVKRILAYSGIAHAGYLLMGVSTQSYMGLYAVLFYLMIYCLMNIGAFWVTAKSWRRFR